MANVEEEPRYLRTVEMEAVKSDDGDLFAVMTIHDDRGDKIQYAFREEGARAIIQSVESWLSALRTN